MFAINDAVRVINKNTVHCGKVGTVTETLDKAVIVDFDGTRYAFAFTEVEPKDPPAILVEPEDHVPSLKEANEKLEAEKHTPKQSLGLKSATVEKPTPTPPKF